MKLSAYTQKPMDLTIPSSPDKKFLRLSSSPASSPRIVAGPSSPTRSVHLDKHSHRMTGSPTSMRKSADFFDDTSSMSSDNGVELYSPGLAGVSVADRKSLFEPGRISAEVASDAFEQGPGPTYFVSPKDVEKKAPVRPAPPAESDLLPPGFMKVVGIDEQSPGLEEFHGTNLNLGSRPLSDAMTLENPNDQRPGTLNTTAWDATFQDMPGIPTPAHLTTHDYVGPSHLSIPLDQAAVTAALNNATREQQILGVHTITMQALLGDTEGLVASSLRASEALDQTLDLPLKFNPATGRITKRVNVVPPPIDVHSKHHIPDNIVRTPYPPEIRSKYRKMPSPLAVEFSIQPQLDARVAVVLQARARHGVHVGNIKRTYVTIPANIDMARDRIKVASPGTKERHFDALDFDDARLFKELHAAYAGLAGFWRFFSARSLRVIRIDVPTAGFEGYATMGCGCACGVDCQCGADCRCPKTSTCCASSTTHSPSSSHQTTQLSSPLSPQSPHHLAPCCRLPSLTTPIQPHHSCHNTTTLDPSQASTNIMTLYRNPNLGTQRYSWVNFIHKVADPSNQGRGRTTPRPPQRRPTGPVPPPLPEKVPIVVSEFEDDVMPEKSTFWEWRKKGTSVKAESSQAKKGSKSCFKTTSMDTSSAYPYPNSHASDFPLDHEDSFPPSSTLTPPPTLNLTFTITWSIPRILAALFLVLALSTTACLLWIFLGTSFLGDGTLKVLSGSTGYRGAGARVGEGCLVGGLVLGFGWSVVGGWVFVSWIVE